MGERIMKDEHDPSEHQYVPPMPNENADYEYKRGRREAIEECAKIIETQNRGLNYEWVGGSFWGTMTKKFAAMVRRLNT